MNGKSRVVFFDAYPHVVGGAQVVGLQLMKGLTERGWRVSLAVPGDGPLVAAARAAGIEVAILDFPDALRVYGRRTTGRRAAGAVIALPRTWFRVAKWLKANADIVHVADHRGQLLIGPAARLSRRRVVWHVHAIVGNRLLNMVTAAFANRGIAPTRAAIDAMPGVEWRRAMFVVPNAVDDRYLVPLDSRPSSPPVIVATGRLHPDKGFDVLLRAAAILRQSDLVTVRILGDAQPGWEHYRTELLHLRDSLGLGDSVDFAGYADPLHHLMTASAYVQPSRTESQGIALLEAMAVGVPVVGTRVPGIVDTLSDGAYGLLVSPEDPTGMAAALRQLLARSDDVISRAKRASEYVQASATRDHVLDRIEEIYAEL